MLVSEELDLKLEPELKLGLGLDLVLELELEPGLGLGMVLELELEATLKGMVGELARLGSSESVPDLCLGTSVASLGTGAGLANLGSFTDSGCPLM